MAHRDLGVRMMNEIRDGLADVSKVDSPPRPMGRRMTMVLSPERKTTKSGDKAAKPAPDKSAAAPRAVGPVSGGASRPSDAEDAGGIEAASTLSQG